MAIVFLEIFPEVIIFCSPVERMCVSPVYQITEREHTVEAPVVDPDIWILAALIW
jgi:hypothetical protein